MADETKVPRLSEGARQKLERLEAMCVGEDAGIAASLALSQADAIAKLEAENARLRQFIKSGLTDLAGSNISIVVHAEEEPD